MVKQLPDFTSQDEERAFWATHDSADYLDWNQAKPMVFAKLKPSIKTISLRLAEFMLNELRLLANRHVVPYQSLIRIVLRERIDQELRPSRCFVTQRLRTASLHLLLTTTTVTSSAGSAPPVNAASAPQIAPIVSPALSPRLAAITSRSRSSPNISPSPSIASVTPSV